MTRDAAAILQKTTRRQLSCVRFLILDSPCAAKMTIMEMVDNMYAPTHARVQPY
jgi:hypothetical protein